MAIERINNQAVKLNSPSETSHNNKTSKCEWHLDYFQLMTCDDTSDIIVNSTVIATGVETDGEFTFALGGTNTNVSPNNLRDTGATFISSGVQVGMYVMVDSGSGFALSAKVTALTSETVIALDSDVFTSTSIPYEISHWDYDGEVTTLNNDWQVNLALASGAVLQQDCLTVGKAYKMSFEITTVDAESAGDQLRVLIGGNGVLTLDETDIIATSYTVYGIASDTYVRFETDENMIISIDNIDVSEVSLPAFYIMNCDTTVDVYRSVLANIQLSTISSQVKMSVDWSNVSDGYTCDGCYYLAVLDAGSDGANINKDRISNGDFTVATNWTFNTGWSHASSMANVVPSPPGNLVQSTLANDFKTGRNYDITLTISNYVAGSLTIQLYSSASLKFTSASFSGDGVHVISTGILTADCDEIFIIPTGSTDLSVDDVSAVINLDDVTFDYTTDCYQLAESHDCTVLLSGTNLDNAFGIDFIGLGYNPGIRVEGELTTKDYDGEKVNEEDSLGVSKTLYFKSEKKRDLFLYQIPEYLHDFVRLLIGYDTFQVDNVAYLAEEATYSPQIEKISGKTLHLSNSTTTLRLKTDLNENKFC